MGAPAKLGRTRRPRTGEDRAPVAVARSGRGSGKAWRRSPHRHLVAGSKARSSRSKGSACITFRLNWMGASWDDEYLTVKEIAERLKLNQQTVRNWIDDGRLSAVRIGRRVRVRRVDLDRILAQGATAETDPQ